MATRKSKGNTAADRLEELDCIDDVDAMLLDGSSATDVGRFIQRTMMRLKDVAHSTITTALRARAKNLKEQAAQADAEAGADGDLADDQETILFHPATTGPYIEVDEEGEIQGEPSRSPTILARTMYGSYVRGFDTLLELESLYLAQRDRISMMMAVEQRSGVPIETTVVEFKEARMLLQAHTKATATLGLSGNDDRLRMTLDIRATRAKHGDSVAEVLENPSSRHKLLTMVKALAGAKVLHQVVADVEPTESG